MINMTVLKTLMEAKGYTFAKLERTADIGNGVIKDWGTRTPNLKNVIKVCDVLGCSIETLVDRDCPTKG